MQYDLIIKNGKYYDIENDRIIKKDIAIKDGIIVKISDYINGFCKKINANNKLIIPGFINTHIHFGEYYIKGYKKKLTTKEYIEYAEKFNEKNKNDSELIRKSSSIICAKENLSYGTTTMVGIRGWDCLEKSGIRLYMGYPLMNSKKLKKYLEEPFFKFEEFKRNDLNDYYIFLHSLLTVNEEILNKLKEYIKNNNIKIAVHVSETKEENEIIKKKYNMSPIEVLEKYQLLNENTLLVHCCYISDNDIKIIKKHHCTISINPNSNLKLNNQIPNINKLKGINICVGTDGVATNDSLNIIDSLKTIGLIYDITEYELLKMITINPSKYLKINVGLIKEGYKADLIIYNLFDNRFVREETYINNLIYSSSIKPCYVIINGKMLVEKNKILCLKDEKNISKRLNF